MHTHEFKLEDAEAALLTLGRERFDGTDPICITLHPSAIDNVDVMQVVTLKNVSKSYHGVTVVDDLSLEIASGEIVALLGQTGAGKSTIMNMIMGQTSPTSGEIRVHNCDPRGDDAALRGFVAVSFQTDRLLPWRTAEQNVALGLEYLRVPKDQRRARARDWLNRVKLDTAHHRKFPHQLSGGMRQRVSLARAMSINPELVLLDESFSQLDHTTSKILREDFVGSGQRIQKDMPAYYASDRRRDRYG